MSYDSLPQMGVPVHHRDLESVLHSIDTFVDVGRRTGRSHQVVTVNTDFLVQARRHEDVHAILRSADLAVPDGMPIVWASAVLGQPLPSRIAGADLVPALAEQAARRGHRMMLFGGSEGVAAQAACELSKANPGLVVASTTAMVSPSGDTPVEVLDEIHRFNPDMICVALGHPKQERWIRRHGSTLGIPVSIGVGGTFEFIAGQVPRAAPWIQRSGFEWLYRLAREPRRLTRRYVTDIGVYIPSMAMQIARTRTPRRGRRYEGSRQRHPARLPKELEWVRSDAECVVVALTRRGPLDHRTVAALTSMATNTQRHGRQLRLAYPGLEAARSLQRLQLDRLIPLLPPDPSSGCRS
ncbi:MAG: WecB/TagA/CpsF family glycosyltransferase [Acidimicrobiia bacterium]|nr:WecB/TagA/CpsF family glycosyltransferase [Acidimicrobiia bacterium]